MADAEGEKLFFSDTTPGQAPSYAIFGCYSRQSDVLLGEHQKEEDEEALTDRRSRCFNCGSPEHIVSACPEPFDRALVALSRQLYDFHHADAPTHQRIHVVEEWRQQRLHWLNAFQPGEVRGSALKEALGLSDGQDGEWLRNMTIWGYPRGWTGAIDPLELVRQRIEEGFVDTPFDAEEQESFEIVNDDGEVEYVSLGHSRSVSANGAASGKPEVVSKSADPNRRWASYPGTFFSSELLPLYNGYALPPITGADDPVPPFLPPPPLPPLPPTELPPLPPPASAPSRASLHLPNDKKPDDDGDDMDVSDSD